MQRTWPRRCLLSLKQVGKAILHSFDQTRRDFSQTFHPRADGSFQQDHQKAERVDVVSPECLGNRTLDDPTLRFHFSGKLEQLGRLAHADVAGQQHLGEGVGPQVGPDLPHRGRVAGSAGDGLIGLPGRDVGVESSQQRLQTGSLPAGCLLGHQISPELWKVAT